MAARHSVGIVTDSTADLPAGLAEAHSILVVPALLIIDGRTYADGQEFSRSDFYRELPHFRTPPTTATPPPARFEAAYQALFEQGLEKVLSLHLAAGLSGIFSSATQAAAAFPGQVRVLDSGQLSLGLGFQVLELARSAKAGMGITGLLSLAAEVRSKVRVAALINTLEYLRRSGRVGWLKAGVGDLLRFKQLLGITDGTVEDLGKARTFERALQGLIRIADGWGSLKRLSVLHTGAAELAEGLADQLAIRTDEPPFTVEVTTIIGAHIGPGSVGLAAQLI